MAGVPLDWYGCQLPHGVGDNIVDELERMLCQRRAVWMRASVSHDSFLASPPPRTGVSVDSSSSWSSGVRDLFTASPDPCVELPQATVGRTLNHEPCLFDEYPHIHLRPKDDAHYPHITLRKRRSWMTSAACVWCVVNKALDFRGRPQLHVRSSGYEIDWGRLVRESGPIWRQLAAVAPARALLTVTPLLDRALWCREVAAAVLEVLLRELRTNDIGQASIMSQLRSAKYHKLHIFAKFLSDAYDEAEAARGPLQPETQNQ